jgi:hypothetical protein
MPLWIVGVNRARRESSPVVADFDSQGYPLIAGAQRSWSTNMVRVA